MYHSELIFRVLNNKLTPELNKYVDLARSELEYAWDIDLPKPEGRFFTYDIHDDRGGFD